MERILEMAYISGRCVTCKEKTKQSAGEYNGRDEKGKRFWGRLYVCEKTDCDINRTRMWAEKDFRRDQYILSVKTAAKPHSNISRKQKTHRIKG